MDVCMYVLWSLITTRIEVGDFCCNHCDSKWVCCDFVWPKKLRNFTQPKPDMLRLCATQKRYVATIATQNGYVVTLRERKICATLREPKQIWCEFARPQKDVLRLCAIHKKYVANIATQNGYVATLCDRRDLMRLCATQKRCFATIATQKGYVVTLRDRKIARLCATQDRYDATLRDSKKVCCGHCDSKRYVVTLRLNHCAVDHCDS